jgi:hypothetical protein
VVSDDSSANGALAFEQLLDSTAESQSQQVLALVVAGAGVVISRMAAGIAAKTRGHGGSGTAGWHTPLFTDGFPLLVPWP